MSHEEPHICALSHVRAYPGKLTRERLARLVAIWLGVSEAAAGEAVLGLVIAGLARDDNQPRHLVITDLGRRVLEADAAERYPARPPA